MDEETLEMYKEAGAKAKKALEFGKGLIKPGASVLQIIQQVEQYIFDMEGLLAFPAQISLDSTAAHFCPTKDSDIILDKQIAKIDLGVHIDGFIADTALTVDLSKSNSELLKASQEALKAALEMAKPGIKVSNIGKQIQETIENHGFKPIKNLSGHTLDEYELHVPPSIPNFDNKDDSELEEGQAIAIEPFASTGAGLIEERGNPTVFAIEEVKPVRVNFVRAMLNNLIMRHGLPFAEHWLTTNFSEAQTNFALKQFDKLEILRKYPPLVDKADGLVSQAEHTVIVREDPLIITK
jgi:methionyl aminopeptidase